MSDTSQPTVTATESENLQEVSKINWELERAKMLFDYTKFHIGMYATLAALLVATLGSKFAADWHVWEWSIATGVIFIALAGLAGGIVAASLPEVMGRDADFWKAPTGPGDKKWRPVEWWAHKEHLLFWIGVLFVLVGFAPVLGQKESDRRAQSMTITGYRSLVVNGETIEVKCAEAVEARN